MSMIHNLLFEENERLRKQLDELVDFVYVVQVACSHLLQDGEVSEEGLQTAKNLFSLTEELQDKYAKED